MASRSRRVVAALLTAIASLSLALLASEGISRLLLDPPRYHREPVELDPDFGFRGVPNHRYSVATRTGSHEVVLNGDGLRGRELPDAPPGPGVRRIAFLGDSFLVGEAVGAEELVTTRVETALREQGGVAEVYNLAHVDWGTGQQLLLLDRVGPTLQPDTVVLALYPSNDIVNNARGLSRRTTTSPGDPIRPYVIPHPGGLQIEYIDPAASWLRRHSRLFATLERRLRSFDEVDTEFATRWERLQAGRMPLEELEVFREHAPGHLWEVAWEDTFKLLRALAERCEGLGARLVVLVIPSIHQVEQTAEAVRFGVEAQVFARRPLRTLLDWNVPDQRLGTFLVSAGIEGVLSIDRLRAAVRSGGSVYARDGHLNPRGHEALAQVVLQALGQEEAIPQEVVQGGPVPWPLALGARLLDFRSRPQDERLGAGWLTWTLGEALATGRWLMGPAGLVALEPDTGFLVLKGVVPPDYPLPAEITAQVIGMKSQTLTIKAAGAFELRFQPVSNPARSESGHVAVIFAANQGGVLVETVGFESKHD